MVGIGKYGSIALSISLFFSVFWVGWVMLKTHESQSNNYEKLSKIIQIEEESGDFLSKNIISRKLKMVLFWNKLNLLIGQIRLFSPSGHNVHLEKIDVKGLFFVRIKGKSFIKYYISILYLY